MSHTPTPFMLFSCGTGEPNVIEGDLRQDDEGEFSGRRVCTFDVVVADALEQQKEDAAFIVSACNAHDELVAALLNQYCVACKGKLGDAKPHSEPCLCDEARAALAKVQPAKVTA